MSKLREPEKGLRALHLLSNHLLHHIPSMDIDSTDGHDLLSVPLLQLSKQKCYQCIQLYHLPSEKYMDVVQSNHFCVSGLEVTFVPVFCSTLGENFHILLPVWKMIN